MQWIAMLTMLIDHIGAAFYPDQAWFRIVGRIAFPLYVYFLVAGYMHTRNYKRYVLRLAVLAIISQPFYQLAFDTRSLNIIVTLLAGLLLFKLLDTVRQPIVQGLAIVVSVLAAEWLSFDYGAYGIVLMLIYRYFQKNKLLLAHSVLELIFLVVWGLQFFSLVVTLFISTQHRIVSTLERARAPKWLWRSFYALHLCIIAIIRF
ncbi:TraX family protein [Paenibacillus septentrionalis]|uniref:TraX family protein n=1 Tax=Paenibacillus septentrionalis TaxID=429342 RepID=A0ABW1V632_9BACL